MKEQTWWLESTLIYPDASKCTKKGVGNSITPPVKTQSTRFDMGDYILTLRPVVLGRYVKKHWCNSSVIVVRSIL